MTYHIAGLLDREKPVRQNDDVRGDGARSQARILGAGPIAVGLFWFCAGALILLGAATEIYWAWGNPTITGPFSWLATVNPTTALLFLLGGATLVTASLGSSVVRWLVPGTSLVTFLVAAIKLAGSATWHNFPADRLLFSSRFDSDSLYRDIGMKPAAATVLVMLALALPTIAGRSRRVGGITTLGVGVALAVTLVSWVGYFFTAIGLYPSGAFGPMSFPTSIGCALYAVGLLALRPDEGLMALLLSRSMGSLLMRRLLPVVLLLPLLLAFTRERLVRAGWLMPQMGLALAVAVNMIVVTAIVTVSVVAINRLESNLRDALYEQGELTQRLKEAAILSEEANRTKSEFLANMSHEIRTPLNGVSGMLHLLERTELNTTQRNYVNTIRGSAESLLAIINDIIDVSKIEAGKLTIESVPFDPKEIITDVARLFELTAREKGFGIGVEIPWGTPVQVVGDPVRFRQVATNLVSNAVKFTHRGFVRLELTANNEGDHTRLSFTVRDSGIGIPYNRLDKIFDSFTQADSSTTRTFGGSGLGLTISRKLVEAMDGALTVQSAVNVGSAFSATLRLPNASYDATPICPLRGQRVVLIESDKTVRLTLEKMLACFGARVVAESSLSDLDEIDTPFDLAVVGQSAVSMAPPLALSNLRAWRTLLSVPVGETESEVAAKLVGSSGVLTFPPSEDVVVPVLTGEVASSYPTFSNDEPLKGIRILLAEDHPVNQLVATDILEGLGAEVILAEDGEEVLRRLARETVDVVLMDCHMPKMDGYEATRTIRRMAGPISHVPILAVTASALESDREQCIRAGMDGFVFKPVRPEHLLAEILRVVRTHAL